MSNTSKKSIDLTPQPHLTISAHEKPVCGIVYLPDGRLVTCSDDETVRIWNLENGEQEGMTMEHGGGVAGWVRGLAVTRDGKRILSGGPDKVLRVWDVETHQPIEEWGDHEDTIHCIVISPDDQLVASGDGEGRIVIREMKEGQTKHVIETVPGDVNSICFSPDGTRLASAHDDTMIRVFDVENDDLIVGPIQGHTRWVSSVVWSLDGSRLFTASMDHSIRLWDSETGEAIGDPWTGHINSVLSMCLSPDGTKLASGSSDDTVRFWGTESGDPIGEPLLHGKDVWVVTFSPSGEFVACGGEDGKVSIWRVPWWDNRNIEAHKSLLDLPAFTLPSHTARHIDNQFDYLDLPTNRRPSPPRTRLRDIHATEDPSRTQGSVLSWRLWRTLPRLLLGRSHGSPRHAELTTIYPGFATYPIDVVLMDDESTRERPTEPVPAAPGHYPGFSIMVESVSSTDSIQENQTTAAPADNSEDVQASCCALFSRQRAPSGTMSVVPPIPLSERTAATSNSPAHPISTLSHTTAQNVLDLPAVIEPSSAAP